MSDNYEQPGWPRSRSHFDSSDTRSVVSRHRFNGMMPVPWIIRMIEDTDQAQWTRFKEDSNVAHEKRLCQVCGERLETLMILMVADGSETSGPGTHPRCAALSAKFCPHLVELAENDDIVGYLFVDPSEQENGYSIPDHQQPFQGGEAYENPNEIDSRAIPLKRPEIIKLARLNPMGTRAGGLT